MIENIEEDLKYSVTDRREGRASESFLRVEGCKEGNGTSGDLS